MKILSDERYGMVMIVATLIVISLIGWKFLIHRQDTRLVAIKAEGRNAVRLLTNLPYAQLLPQHRRSDILELLNNKQTNSGFAYAAIVDLKGRPVAVSTSGESAIPSVDMISEKSLWATEHEIPADKNSRELLEFRAPVLNQGELAGYVRIGYFKPRFELTEISFIAQLALPIFLLVPLAYLMIRRELKPLKQASYEINAAMQKQHIKSVSSDTADFNDFMLNFQRFVGEIDKRFKEANEQNFRIKASGLALTYQRQRTESALQSLPDAVLVMDENGKATFANSKLAPLLGVSLEQVIGFDVHEWSKNQALTSLLTKFQHSQHQQFQRPDSLEYHPPNNTGLTILVTTYPLFSPKDSETITGTLVVFRDKTSEVMARSLSDFPEGTPDIC